MALDRDLLQEALTRYEILGEIGRGGWGIVLEGRHRELGRRVAIKQLPRAFGADPAVRERFVAEARLVASLDHPHIVPVFDFVGHEGLYLIVMELASGGTLWDRFNDHGLETDQSVGIALAVAVGLHYAHAHGVLHRDVKPENVLFSGSGTAKIADFGIAKAMGETGGNKTATGTIMGTAAYMAPEQVTGADLTPATDVYALAVMLYELLSGQLPFPEVTEPIAQLYQHVHDTPRDFGEIGADVPEHIAEVTFRALEKDPADRPASAQEFAVDLAVAATRAFGPGWLSRSGIAVMSATSVVGATEREPPGETDRRAGTIVVRAEREQHQRLGAVQSGRETGADAEPHVDATMPPVAEPAPPGTAPPSSVPPAPGTVPPAAAVVPPAPAPPAQAPTPPPQPSPVQSQAPVHPSPAPVPGYAPAPAQTPQPAGKPGSRRNLVLAAAALLAVIAVSIFFILGGSDDGNGETANSSATTTKPSNEPVADAEVERFRDECTASGVTDERCGCVIDRALVELAPEEFRSALTRIEETGGELTGPMTSVFNDCVDDGF